MTCAGHPAARPVLGRWFLVALTLFGLMGQLALQGFSLPDEMPRATILRLTGIDISPRWTVENAAVHPHHLMEHQDGMMVMPSDMPHHETTHHTHDDSCVICPLLIIFGVLLTCTPFLPLVSTSWLVRWRHLIQPRAPPVSIRTRPPSRAPPLPA